jgi:HK97 family phage portal protein
MRSRNLLTVMASGMASVFKATVPVTTVPGYAVNNGTWWGSIRDSFPGAWQAGVAVDPHSTLLAFSAVYSCVTLIAGDISKLRIKLVQQTDGIWAETTSSAFSPVLRKPNHYQTRVQFLNQWVQSKLIWGNTYVLKERDNRGGASMGVVTALYCLDPRLVKVLVSDGGEVFYQISTTRLIGSLSSITVPASEIIHDRAACLFDPLIGVGPIYACGSSATQGNRIQKNSSSFFDNMSRPSGHLTAAGTITDATAARLKKEFEAGFSGTNLGRLLVTGDGLKYEPMTIPAQQAQLIEQLRWTVEDVARCFRVPLHKIGAGQNVKFSNMAEMNQDYYSQTLQELIEGIEILLDEGLGLTKGTQVYGTELDLEGLLRMDPIQRAQRNQIAMDAGYMAPDEARASENLAPVPGGAGKEPFMQQQKFPLSVLVKQPAPGSTPAVAAPDPAVAAAAQSAASAAAKAADISVSIDAAFRKHMDVIEARATEETARGQQLKLQFDEVREDVKALVDMATAPTPGVEEEEDDAGIEELAAALIAQFTGAANVE